MTDKVPDKKVAVSLKLNLLKRLDGKTFCQTGKMSMTRQQLDLIITTLGGTSHAAIKSTTQYLIVPNGNEFRKGSKYQAANKAGTMVITEQEFCELILPSIDELMGDGNGNGESY